MTRFFLTLYVGSFLIAVLFWNFGHLTIDPFKFHVLTVTQFFAALNIYASFFVATIAGAFCAQRFPNLKFKRIKFKKRAEIVALQLIIFFVLTFELLATWTISLGNGVGFKISDRQYIDNLSMIKILLLCLMSNSLMLVGFRNLVLALVNAFAFCLVTLDVTREAVIPLFFLLMLLRVRDVGFWFTGLNLVFCTLYSFLGRDGGEISLYVWMIYFAEAINYIFGMCYLHFTEVFSAYSVSQGNGFNFNIFLGPIAPVPGSWVGSEQLDGRNFDAFRPYGAASDLAIWSPYMGMIVFFVYGFSVSLGLSANSKLVRSLAVILAILFFVWLFQYHLRTSFKFIVVAGFAFVLARRKNRKI